MKYFFYTQFNFVKALTKIASELKIVISLHQFKIWIKKKKLFNNNYLLLSVNKNAIKILCILYCEIILITLKRNKI